MHVCECISKGFRYRQIERQCVLKSRSGQCEWENLCAHTTSDYCCLRWEQENETLLVRNDERNVKKSKCYTAEIRINRNHIKFTQPTFSVGIRIKSSQRWNCYVRKDENQLNEEKRRRQKVFDEDETQKIQHKIKQHTLKQTNKQTNNQKIIRATQKPTAQFVRQHILANMCGGEIYCDAMFRYVCKQIGIYGRVWVNAQQQQY